MQVDQAMRWEVRFHITLYRVSITKIFKSTRRCGEEVKVINTVGLGLLLKLSCKAATKRLIADYRVKCKDLRRVWKLTENISKGGRIKGQLNKYRLNTQEKWQVQQVKEVCISKACYKVKLFHKIHFLATLSFLLQLCLVNTSNISKLQLLLRFMIKTNISLII